MKMHLIKLLMLISNLIVSCKELMPFIMNIFQCISKLGIMVSSSLGFLMPPITRKKKKCSLYEKYINESLPGLKKELLDKYKIFKNKLTIIIRAAEKRYYQNKLNSVKESMSKTWKLLNSRLFRSGKQKSVCEIELNGSMVSDPNILANNFNNYFTNIGSNLAKKYQPVI